MDQIFIRKLDAFDRSFSGSYDSGYLINRGYEHLGKMNIFCSHFIFRRKFLRYILAQEKEWVQLGYLGLKSQISFDFILVFSNSEAFFINSDPN